MPDVTADGLVRELPLLEEPCLQRSHVHTHPVPKQACQRRSRVSAMRAALFAVPGLSRDELLSASRMIQPAIRPAVLECCPKATEIGHFRTTLPYGPPASVKARISKVTSRLTHLVPSLRRLWIDSSWHVLLTADNPQEPRRIHEDGQGTHASSRQPELSWVKSYQAIFSRNVAGRANTVS